MQCGGKEGIMRTDASTGAASQLAIFPNIALEIILKPTVCLKNLKGQT
jgi:hypothetical protein